VSGGVDQNAALWGVDVWYVWLHCFVV